MGKILSSLVLITILVGCTSGEESRVSKTVLPTNIPTQISPTNAPTQIPPTSVARIPSVTVLNYTNIPTADIILWTETSIAEINYLAPDILAAIWPIGRETGEVLKETPFNKHTSVMTSEEMDSLVI